MTSTAAAQELPAIEIIDFYGLRTIQEDAVRALLPFQRGVSVQPDVEAIAATVASGLGVTKVEIAGVCCTDSGGAVIFVGVEEAPMPTPPYLPPQRGSATLAAEIVATSKALDEALWAAIRRGEASEDWSRGHSLVAASEGRVLQERFVDYAERYWDDLLEVLHDSADGDERAIAAQVVAYAMDKAAVVPHLEQAALDSDSGVRNNATRALLVIAQYARANPSLDFRIAPDPFIDMLGSIRQTDRNKGSFLVMTLSEGRDPALLEKIRTRALFPLVEMCHWKHAAHGTVSCQILERVLGLPDRAPPYDADAKRELTLAAMPLLSPELKSAAERFVRASAPLGQA